MFFALFTSKTKIDNVVKLMGLFFICTLYIYLRAGRLQSRQSSVDCYSRKTVVDLFRKQRKLLNCSIAYNLPKTQNK